MWTAPPVVALFLVVAGFLSVSAVRMMLRAAEIQKERIALESKVRELEARKADLEASLANIDSPGAIERAAKDKLDLKNPGEEVVVVEPDRATTTGKRPSGFVSFLPGWLAHVFQFFGR